MAPPGRRCGIRRSCPARGSQLRRRATPEDLTTDEYPFEVFRRIIYLPGSGAKEDLSWLEMLEDFLPAEEPSAATGPKEVPP